MIISAFTEWKSSKLVNIFILLMFEMIPIVSAACTWHHATTCCLKEQHNIKQEQGFVYRILIKIENRSRQKYTSALRRYNTIYHKQVIYIMVGYKKLNFIHVGLNKNNRKLEDLSTQNV